MEKIVFKDSDNLFNKWL